MRYIGEGAWIPVSIHAPREGSDSSSYAAGKSVKCFNPRPPRGERLALPSYTGPNRVFQSTPPARGATRLRRPSVGCAFSFNPRPPRGERRCDYLALGCATQCFNPRPPRGERRFLCMIVTHPELFQSTPPARGATSNTNQPTHTKEFQSTPPARGATKAHYSLRLDAPVSIHAPREGSDLHLLVPGAMVGLFQSTPPARGATSTPANSTTNTIVSIHAPREGSDACNYW